MKISKAMKKEFDAKARELARRFNPYKNSAIKYYIDRVQMYIFADKTWTAEEIFEAYVETAVKDMEHGYEERMIGYYDKWYRYSRADEGAAYDIGCRLAADNEKSAEELIIIPCIH